MSVQTCLANRLTKSQDLGLGKGKKPANSRVPPAEWNGTVFSQWCCCERLLSYQANVRIIAEVNADPRVLTLPCISYEVVVFVNVQRPSFECDSAWIQDLNNQKVVQCEVGSTKRTAMKKALQDHQVSIDVVLGIGSREGIWKAVEQGLGIGFLTDFEFAQHPNLRAIPIKGAGVNV